MLNFDEINDILNDMAEAGIVEPMVEPIDDPSMEVNFWDWADVVGAVDGGAHGQDYAAVGDGVE